MLNSINWIEIVVSAIAGWVLGSVWPFLRYVFNKGNERKSQKITYKNDYFARETIKYRFKDIICKVNDANTADVINYPDVTNSYPHTDILSGYTFDTRQEKEFIEEWKQNIMGYGGSEEFFINAPFIDVEHYFYFYILDKFNSGKNSKSIIDPYYETKIKALKDDWAAGHDKSKIYRLLEIADRIGHAQGDDDWSRLLDELLEENLSANSTDLSQMFWEKFSEVRAVLDNKDKFWASYVCNMRNVKRINILVDNFGIELLSDLVLGYYFVCRKGKNSEIEIVYHTNKLPVYVSDVFIAGQSHANDVELLMNTLSGFAEKDESGSRITEVLCRINNMIKTKFSFKPNLFWNMPVRYEDLFTTKYKSLANFDVEKSIFTGSDLLVIKGDLNYRRLVGDTNYWPGKSISSLIKYVNAPLLIIRSFKSNVTLLGKSYSKFIKTKPAEDWQSNGRYGIIQFIDKSK